MKLRLVLKSLLESHFYTSSQKRNQNLQHSTWIL
ncbi:hypothetical protein LINPERPRIM_LOCUS41265 [Linum perenne]